MAHGENVVAYWENAILDPGQLPMLPVEILTLVARTGFPRKKAIILRISRSFIVISFQPQIFYNDQMLQIRFSLESQKCFGHIL